MFEQGARWNEYYRELDPGKRRQQRDTLFREEPDDGANQVRAQLFDSRHTNPNGSADMVDTFLWQCVNLCFLYHSKTLFRKSGMKQAEEAIRSLCLPIPEEADEEKRAAVERAYYWEYRNAVRRYYDTCTSSGYRRKVFGLMQSSEDEKKTQMLKDTWEMSRGAAGKFGKEAELELWIRAVEDEYACQDDRAADRLAEYHRKHAGTSQ